MTMLRRTTAVVLSLLLLVQTCFATIEVDEEGLEELMGLGECAKTCPWMASEALLVICHSHFERLHSHRRSQNAKPPLL